MNSILMRASVLITLSLPWLVAPATAAPVQLIDLWPGGAPGESGGSDVERDMTKPNEGLVAGERVIRLGNVTRPTLSVYRPPAGRETGAAVMVCPGGGYHILAMDLEGTEVCEWLSSVGVTAFLLKYRVPAHPGAPRHGPALQDAERALGLVRHRAGEWSVSPERIGVLGFSAGGHLSAALSNRVGPRSYNAVDAADGVSCRPDFTLLIYPAYLTLEKEGDKLTPEVTVTSNTPPAFVVMAEDDAVRVENALYYTLALKRAKVPVELHVYPTGGHGYGLRPSKNLVSTWPKRAEDWFRSRGLLERK